MQNNSPSKAPTMPKTHAPYVTITPWVPFTPREHKRPGVLERCPSPRCQRSGACVSAYDNLYCQRTHASPAKYKVKTTPDREALYRYHLELTERWKSGDLNAYYGKYKPQGVVKHPPARLRPN
jgi:hypothetical protein